MFYGDATNLHLRVSQLQITAARQTAKSFRVSPALRCDWPKGGRRNFWLKSLAAAPNYREFPGQSFHRTESRADFVVLVAVDIQGALEGA